MFYFFSYLKHCRFQIKGPVYRRFWENFALRSSGSREEGDPSVLRPRLARAETRLIYALRGGWGSRAVLPRELPAAFGVGALRSRGA